MSDRLYILNGRTPKPCPDAAKWRRWFETADRQVARTKLGVGGEVLTEFIGIDHNFSDDGPPLLFETLVFHDDIDNMIERTSNWDAALAAHDRMVMETLLRLALMRAVEDTFEQ